MSPLVEDIRAQAYQLDGPQALNPLLGLIGDAQLVLLGAATHGTHESFRKRMEITQRLITEKGFNIVAADADWPELYRVNQYVTGPSADTTSLAALGNFQHFPAWTWRNRDFLDFVGWLKQHNEAVRIPRERVECVGLDLYGLRSTVAKVMQALHENDIDAEHWARTRFASFDHAAEVPHPYDPVMLDIERSHINQMVAQLAEQMRAPRDRLDGTGRESMAGQFYLEHSNRIIRSAELYYRSLFEERISSWNLHEEHMLGTLSALIEFYRMRQQQAKVVVWSHNAHIGDSRATQLGAAGEWNIGELVRELYGDKAVLVGFTTHHGTVTATTEWDGPAQQMQIRPAVLGSYEALFHDTAMPAFMLTFGPDDDLTDALYQPRLERAIGAVYLTSTERLSHYFQARLSAQFNAVLHFDQTRAIEPLERTVQWDQSEPREQYPHAA